MFVKNTNFDLTIKVRKDNYKSGRTNYKYIINRPDKTVGAYALLNLSGLTSTTDGSVVLTITEVGQSGLYELIVIQDSDTAWDVTMNDANIIGKYYYNVVEADTTSSVTM